MSFLILLVGNKIKAQKAIDLHFSKIVWANYIADMPKNMHSNKLTIDFYAEINSSGIMIFLEIDADNGKEKYFSYKLTEMQLQALDSVFNGSISLNKHLEDTDHIEGMPYAGQYDYLSVITKGNKKDEICFVASDMSEKFKNTISMLREITYKEEEYATTVVLSIPSQIKPSILKLHKKSKYLPLIGSPPPPMMQ